MVGNISTFKDNKMNGYDKIFKNNSLVSFHIDDDKQAKNIKPSGKDWRAKRY